MMSKFTEFITTSQPKNPKLHISLIVISVICVIVGIVLFSCINYKFVEHIIADYTYCKNGENIECINILTTNSTCECFQNFNVSTHLKKPVFVSYSLSGYDQFNDEYFNSRDENQLKGKLSLTPSDKCGQYTYADTPYGRKPIAPCGEVADSMFNDILIVIKSHKEVPLVFTGLISETVRAKYRNPPGDLITAFANFTKPIHWTRNVTSMYDSNSTNNNGFENEAFIIWMERSHTQDINKVNKLPMYARVDHSKDYYADGMPAGTYSIKIEYNYPVPKNGRKSIVFWSMDSRSSQTNLAFGIIFLIVGLISLAFFLTGWLLKTTQDTSKSIQTGSSQSNEM